MTALTTRAPLAVPATPLELLLAGLSAVGGGALVQRYLAHRIRRVEEAAAEADRARLEERRELAELRVEVRSLTAELAAARVEITALRAEVNRRDSIEALAAERADEIARLRELLVAHDIDPSGAHPPGPNLKG